VAFGAALVATRGCAVAARDVVLEVRRVPYGRFVVGRVRTPFGDVRVTSASYERRSVTLEVRRTRQRRRRVHAP